jgi:RNA polymerase sigma factor (sigma-70 family)
MKMRISHPVLRDFFDQLRFAPIPQKKKQLTASEHLLMILDAEREYPFDFIVYRITGYRPPEKPEQHLISGRDLMPDMRVWIARLSAELHLDASEQDEPIFTVEQLAARFAVSTKTIRRWQKRGLTGKIYIFDDGRKRMGFTQSTVDLFTKDHDELVRQAGQFTLLTAQQREQIASLAKELTGQKNYKTQNELVLEIAGQVHRSRQTVRAVLDDLSQRQTVSPAMPQSRGRMSSKEAVKLYKMSQQNVSVKKLMELFGRSRSSIYRIINQQLARELFSQKIEFVPNEAFSNPDAEQTILSVPPEELLPKKSDRPALLSRQQETDMFQRYNYLKFMACQQRSQIKRGQPRSDRLNHIETLLKQAEAVKKVIIEANMALVVVEKFDYARGYRFSTYASWAIVKGFARLIPSEAKRPDRAGGADFANLPVNLRLEQLPGIMAVEQAHQDLQTIIKNNLDEREQYIILNHYALAPEIIKKKPKTLKQIGDDLHLSKERIRQIELQALQKLRQSLSPEQFDLLTG